MFKACQSRSTEQQNPCSLWLGCTNPNSRINETCLNRVSWTCCEHHSCLFAEVCSTCMNAFNVWCASHFCASGSAICSHESHCLAWLEKRSSETVATTIKKGEALLQEVQEMQKPTAMGGLSHINCTEVAIEK